MTSNVISVLFIMIVVSSLSFGNINVTNNAYDIKNYETSLIMLVDIFVIFQLCDSSISIVGL